jgi:RNA polymerase sigma-70 factor (ECF subfamily)
MSGGAAAAPAERVGDEGARGAANAAMERYATGDEGAFSELYDLLAPRLRAFLLRQVRDEGRADDLLQQTMLQIHCARGRFLRGADVLPWAYAIARRLVIDGFRRRKHEVASESDPATDATSDHQAVDDRLHALRMARAVERELARLPEAHRVAFELVKKDGLSMKEAALVLGTTATAIKLRAHRAYVALRAALGDSYDRG